MQEEVNNKYILIQPYLNTVLEDDTSPNGGVSFSGETLFDFLEEIGDDHIYTMTQVNKVLRECGIKEIKIEREAIDRYITTIIEADFWGKVSAKEQEDLLDWVVNKYDDKNDFWDLYCYCRYLKLRIERFGK